MWLRYVVRPVLPVDPDARTVTLLPADGAAQTLAEGDTPTMASVLPGFGCSVREIFDL